MIEQLVEKLVARRDRMGLNNAEVGRLAGLPQSTVDRALGRRHQTTVAVLERIASALGVRVAFTLRAKG